MYVENWGYFAFAGPVVLGLFDLFKYVDTATTLVIENKRTGQLSSVSGETRFFNPWTIKVVGRYPNAEGQTEAQRVIVTSSDHVELEVFVTAYFRISDVVRLHQQIEGDYVQRMGNSLANFCGKEFPSFEAEHHADRRAAIETQIRGALDEMWQKNYGIQVTRVEIRFVGLPEALRIAYQRAPLAKVNLEARAAELAVEELDRRMQLSFHARDRLITALIESEIKEVSQATDSQALRARIEAVASALDPEMTAAARTEAMQLIEKFKKIEGDVRIAEVTQPMISTGGGASPNVDVIVDSSSGVGTRQMLIGRGRK